ncbi:hypothetical protein [Falsirhodobacter sp. 20TX0035]|uniref:hypothetical protein n=1 Tax=Falsirhodobacter sp. 20TX0035 TaxID=3022019 RepID=UPI00232D3D75|nr:hypothetical protein [Falsirhodobacter sp. 20TX0035]MDB6453157.1 hypothetical protein [Falsirhodobacter sp. 20TX0035]
MMMKMLQRMLVGMVMGKVINKGIDYASRGGKAEADMTPAERAKAKKTRMMAQRARKIARMTNRLR